MDQCRRDRVYAIRQSTAHLIAENARVTRFRELLKTPVSESTLVELAESMYASQESYSASGIGSSGTERWLAMVRDAGPAVGLYGARITGGGSGGTVAVLGRKTADDSIEKIADQYAAETGRGGYVFRGSSPGAWSEEICSVQW